MADATNGVEVGNGRVVRRLADARGARRKPSSARPEPSAQPEPTARPEPSATGADRAWRFVLIVEPEPGTRRGVDTGAREARGGGDAGTAGVPRPVWLWPSGLDRSAVRGLGHGATLLEEPFEPTVKIRFDWPAPSLAEAVASAVRRVRRRGLRVLRVDNDDPVTAADIGARIGRSRETVRTWAMGRSGPGGFPPPVNPRRDTVFYSWVEVLAWLREVKGLDLPEEEPGREAADLAVRLRALLPRLSRPRAIVDLLDGPDATTPGRPEPSAEPPRRGGLTWGNR